MQALPFDSLADIFSFVPEDQRPSLRYVCSRFNKVVPSTDEKKEGIALFNIRKFLERIPVGQEGTLQIKFPHIPAAIIQVKIGHGTQIIPQLPPLITKSLTWPIAPEFQGFSCESFETIEDLYEAHSYLHEKDKQEPSILEVLFQKPLPDTRKISYFEVNSKLPIIEGLGPQFHKKITTLARDRLTALRKEEYSIKQKRRIQKYALCYLKVVATTAVLATLAAYFFST